MILAARSFFPLEGPLHGMLWRWLLARIVFTLTIFVSAFMLFLVQPLIGKLILPKLGGTPQVWNTCMLFFQSALLLGYAYTNAVTTRLKLRQQLALHSAVLAIPIVIMLAFPIYSEVQGWTPPTGSNPIFDTLFLLAKIVGIPFLVVATSAPLLQRWFTYSGDPSSRDPYFLYSASNAGSLLSLLLYPIALEPTTLLATQSYVWFVGYAILAGLILYCAYTIFKTAPSDEQIIADAAATEAALQAKAETETAAPAPAPVTAAEASTAVKSGAAPAAPSRGIQRKKGAKLPGAYDEEKAPSIAPPAAQKVPTGATDPMTAWRRIRWVLLAAVPSSLMLGVTSYISTDLSPFPLIWVLPLALYLLSFIMVYMKGWTSVRLNIGPLFFWYAPRTDFTMHEITLFALQPIGIVILCFIGVSRSFDPVWGTMMTLAGFFFSALACHGELALDRPNTKHLTEYFLLMSVGGALGGTFNGMIAPLVFQGGVREFYIAIVVACFVRPQYHAVGWFDDLILQAFPGLQGWARNQGDEMAKSMGRPEPRSTYLFSVFLDVVLGAFVLAIAALLTKKLHDQSSFFFYGSIMKFLGIGQGWARFVLNVGTFGIPIIFCFFFAGRPLRFGLAVAGLFLGTLYLGTGEDDRTLEARRTYFGVLRVLQESEPARDVDEARYFSLVPLRQAEEGRLIPPMYGYTYLMHGTTYHGRNYIYNPGDDKKQRDISRLATTYYHRYGPVGVVMELDNWFKGRQGTFYSDFRMPAAMIGQVAASFGGMPLPAIVETWSEPPFATIGLGSGTMAGYARPYQHMTYYEIDDVIREFSMPEDSSEGKFTFLQQATRRGVNLEVVMGDARQSLEKLREKDNYKNTYTYVTDFSKKHLDTKGVRHYQNAPYTNINTEAASKDWPGRPESYAQSSAIREKYYKVIVVDAFSSDAIPVHLVTRQAIQIYLDKLTDNGVLCVHTSNRHLDLVRPVARIAKELDIESRKQGEKAAADKTFKDDAERDEFLKRYEINCLVGKDGAEREGFMGHFSSEYVMIFRGDAFQKYVEDIAKRRETLGKGQPPEGQEILNSQVDWYDPYKDYTVTLRDGRRYRAHQKVTLDDSLWTDDYSHIVGVIRWPENLWLPISALVAATLLVCWGLFYLSRKHG
jgi:hypothetical protein